MRYLEHTSTPASLGEILGIPIWAVAVALVVLVVFGAVEVTLTAIRSSRWQIRSGREAMIGEVGDVRRTVEKSGGMVFVHGELWSAVAEDPAQTPVELGTEVEVVGFRRTAVIVRPAR